MLLFIGCTRLNENLINNDKKSKYSNIRKITILLTLFMDSFRIERYQKKLMYLKRYTDWLDDWMEKTSLEQIQEFKKYQDLMGIFHTAQNAIAGIIDIIAMMNKDLANLVQDNYNNLEYLTHEDIINIDLNKGLKELIGLRNRIAHDYNGIIDEMVWISLEKNKHIFTEFHNVIEKWLIQQNV